MESLWNFTYKFIVIVFLGTILVKVGTQNPSLVLALIIVGVVAAALGEK